jgi:hypothetical protein
VIVLSENLSVVYTNAYTVVAAKLKRWKAVHPLVNVALIASTNIFIFQDVFSFALLRYAH